MKKFKHSKLLHAVISDLGKGQIQPRVLIGNKQNGYLVGDIMDANAVDQVVTDVANTINTLQNNIEQNYITSAQLEQTLDELRAQIAAIISNTAPGVDSIAELANAINNKSDFAQELTRVDGENLIISTI